MNVKVKNVRRTFGKTDVLRGVDLTARPGELIALYGPSGSGKTTLLNLIGALDRPSEGEIEVLGQDLLAMREGARAKFRRRQLAFIFQGATLLPNYTALENIDLGLRLLGLGYFERARRAKAALHAVGLSAWADHMPIELSGGQQQRVSIARALALQAKVILADEPTSGIDTANTHRILSLFRKIAEAQETTFLIVTHDPLLMEYVDTTYELFEGKLKTKEAPSVIPEPLDEEDKDRKRNGSARPEPMLVTSNTAWKPGKESPD